MALIASSLAMTLISSAPHPGTGAGVGQGQEIQASLEGIWNVKNPKAPADSKTTVTFRSGRIAARITRMQGGRRMMIDATGTYTFKNGMLSTTMTDAKLDPTPFTAAERKQIFTPQAKENFRKMMTKSASPGGTVRFLSKDRFELKSKTGSLVTFSRAK